MFNNDIRLITQFYDASCSMYTIEICVFKIQKSQGYDTFSMYIDLCSNIFFIVKTCPLTKIIDGKLFIHKK